MSSTVTRRQVFFVKGKKRRSTKVRQESGQQALQPPAAKANADAVFGRGYAGRPVRRASLFSRLMTWSLSLAVLGVALWGSVLIARAVMVKLDEQPTIAAQIAKSRTWRGQSAATSAAPPNPTIERSHAPSNEESFLATYPLRRPATPTPSDSAPAEHSAAAHRRTGEGRVEDCGVRGGSHAATGSQIDDCLKALGGEATRATGG